jgi:FKBP-type peptidyl-prolyl cis-trans isomerase
MRLVAALGVFLFVACGYPDPTVDSGPVATTTVAPPSSTAGGDDFAAGANKTPIKLPDGLQYADVKVGDGAVVGKTDTVSVQYTGWLMANGKKFDSSRDRGEPFEVQLGQHQVISGWDEGIPGMKVGGQRRLTLPPALAYGDQGAPPTIPAKATLVFLVEVLSTKPTPSPSPTT